MSSDDEDLKLAIALSLAGESDVASSNDTKQGADQAVINLLSDDSDDDDLVCLIAGPSNPLYRCSGLITNPGYRMPRFLPVLQ